MDAGNVGAIIRSAAALGVDGVLLSPSCSDPLNRRSARVSMGTVFQIPWAYVCEEREEWQRRGPEILSKLGFVTDMTNAPEETIDQLMGVDTLVIGALRQRPHATHQTIGQAIEVARRVGAKSTYLIHMNHEAGLHAETDALLPEGVHLAHDELTIEF